MINNLKNQITEPSQRQIKKLKEKLKTIKDKAEADAINKKIEELNNDKISSRTIRYVNVVLHAGLDQALKNNLIVRNPSEAVTLPKQQHYQSSNGKEK